jgi:Na+/H+-dicarboxylate symporter
MGRTAVNVTGQALVPLLVARREGILDVARYNAVETIEALDAEAPAVGHAVPAE